MSPSSRMRRAHVGDETQIDMVVSMFAALLVLLLTLAVGGSADQAEQTGDKTQYRAADPPTDAFPLRTACVLNPRKTYYMLRHEVLWRLDDAQIAADWREAGGGRYDHYYEAENVDVSVEPVRGEPLGSYELTVSWRGDSAPPILAPVAPVDAWLSPDLKTSPPMLAGPMTILGRSNEDPESLYALAATLQNQGLRPEIRRAKSLKVVWSAASYTNNSVFRC